MISYTTNQRRSLRYTAGGDWMEEVLAASGVDATATSGFAVVSGSTVQDVLEAIDNVLGGIEYLTTSGILIIDDVANVSGTVGEQLDNLDVITFASGTNNVVRFSFAMPAQPVDPVFLRLACIGRGAAASGNIKYNLEYNIFESGDDVTLAGAYTYSGTATQSFNAADFEKLKTINLTIPTTDFSAAGSAPFIVSCKLTRDVSVGGNYTHNLSLAQIYADNVPGGIVGNQAGYVGGNLIVTGDLTVQDRLILQDTDVPASGTAVGTSGTFLFADDFIYAATATNTWKRTPISNF
jgi:hypothetical protein